MLLVCLGFLLVSVLAKYQTVGIQGGCCQGAAGSRVQRCISLSTPCCSLPALHTILAGAQGIGLLATSLMGNTLEDILALTVAGMASYVAVLNLPLKRSDIKAKVAQRANNFAEGVTAAMAEVRRDVNTCPVT